MNLTYIKAAIEAATGIKLTIDEVKAYLIEEFGISPSRLDKITFRGYGAYYGDVIAETIPDLKEVLVEEGVEIMDEDDDKMV